LGGVWPQGWHLFPYFLVRGAILPQKSPKIQASKPFSSLFPRDEHGFKIVRFLGDIKVRVQKSALLWKNVIIPIHP